MNEWDGKIYRDSVARDLCPGGFEDQEAFMIGARWQREALLADDAIERVARELASLDPGDEWPTNIELGGNPFTGTRDDEYKRGMRERAREVLEAALGVEGVAP